MEMTTFICVRANCWPIQFLKKRKKNRNRFELHAKSFGSTRASSHEDFSHLWGQMVFLLPVAIHAIPHTVRYNLTEFCLFQQPFPIKFSSLTEFSDHFILCYMKIY